ncbi:DUF2807 domain-containing protein [Cellulophaga sp. HaHaR_3_176]|uniref:head GIN domain-containing protein n=1 Tax=Cellulophaga sp. HaHaR_3_176 TaxID=1942464 RepID=UPI001C1F96AC|nr:head GIN domain-containing protein [Cellulophaga sp. HaHaR_3_176]QWX82685.1 DUF2807 domain-containing protein [Cellulophaga sp. HaHaR_3_176]
MTTLVKIAITIAFTILLSSCGLDINIGDFNSGIKGNGVVTEDARSINENFTSISASEGLEVYVTQATDFSILVEADENVINLIETDIKDGELHIHTEKNIGNATKKVYVSLPKISTLNSSSGAYVKTENTIKTGRLSIASSSGSIVNIDINVDNLNLDSSSGSNLNISGTVGNSEIEASSGSNINAKKLTTKYCNASASSGGNINIYVSESINANASSGGNVSYSGDATLTSKKSISGSVSFND